MKLVIWLRFLAGIYGMALVALAALNWKGAERLWPGAVNLYLPQAMWAVPAFILLFAIFKWDRLWTWLPLLCVLCALGPIMDFRWTIKEPQALPGTVPLRIMTWNIKYNRQRVAPAIDEFSRYNPDVVFLQDAWNSMRGPLGTYFKKWHVRTTGQYVIASRYPLSTAEVLELPTSGNREENFVRCRVQIGSETVSLYNVHFQTPRKSFYALRKTRRSPADLPDYLETFNRSVKIRIAQAATVQSHLLQESDPVIVAGDLNAPDASLVCATLRKAGMRDAFAEGGRGYGFTYGHFLLKNRIPWLRLSWMRIDHIMTNSKLKTKRCWAGTADVSDHRPVIADLTFKNP